jgi:hypothetical protein
VNVSDLQQLIIGLGQILTAGGSKAAAELQYLNQKLTPYKDEKLKAFADSLTTGPRPFKSVEEALSALQQLFNTALSPEVTEDGIKAEVGRCEKLTKPKVDELVKRFGLERKFPKKDQALKAIEQKIIDRKGAFERSQI